MTTDTISDVEFNLLRDYIEEHCGIALGDEKAYLVETRLTKLMALSGCDDFGAFYRLAKNGNCEDLRDKIIDAMTTNETLWFRDDHPFEILRDIMLPTLAEQIISGQKRKVRIWSAASSTGQEAYSIAMTIQEFCRRKPGVEPENFEILGTDISSSALFLATAGRYDAIAMGRGLPENFKTMYFHRDGRVWEINDEIKQMVSFKRFNLQEPPSQLGRFDIVFLRYVAIYFSRKFKQSLYQGISEVLDSPGYFFTGAVESLNGLTDEFERCVHDRGHYYVAQTCEKATV